MVRSLDDLAVYQELMPVIRQVIKAGGGADQILKKSEAVAAVKLTQSLNSEKPDVALKAAIEILNRSLGKPVERSVSIYGDLNRMNEKDIDNQIMRAFDRTNSQHIIEAVVTERPALPKIKQKRRSRKAGPLDGQDNPQGQA
jgi:ribosome-binding ATPase YchF (GTP1/OBG family)